MRWSRYSPEFRDPQTDKDYHRKPWAELTEEEKFERELRKTQPIKAAPSARTCSVFEDAVIRLDGTLSLPWVGPRAGLQQGFRDAASGS